MSDDTMPTAPMGSLGDAVLVIGRALGPLNNDSRRRALWAAWILCFGDSDVPIRDRKTRVGRPPGERGPSDIPKIADLVMGVFCDDAPRTHDNVMAALAEVNPHPETVRTSLCKLVKMGKLRRVRAGLYERMPEQSRSRKATATKPGSGKR